MEALDTQVGGTHYKDFKIQPIEYIQANKLSYLQGNVIKYVSRYKSKGGEQDIKKAIHYLELILELEYPKYERDIERGASKDIGGAIQSSGIPLSISSGGLLGAGLVSETQLDHYAAGSIQELVNKVYATNT